MAMEAGTGLYDENENDPERLEREMELLYAMYPGQIAYEDSTRELKYSHNLENDCFLVFRLPAGYPVTGRPEIIRASDARGKSLTFSFKETSERLCLPEGTEVIDEIIAVFCDHIEKNKPKEQEVLPDVTPATLTDEQGYELQRIGEEADSSPKKKTVIVWLHHLLNTSKRKQVISPLSSRVSGISKPGYPGVLIFSGAENDVQEHLSGLKALNWQAFQVRLEEDDEWMFEHGTGVIEVGSISELMKDVGEKRKSVVMEALRMK